MVKKKPGKQRNPALVPRARWRGRCGGGRAPCAGSTGGKKEKSHGPQTQELSSLSQSHLTVSPLENNNVSLPSPTHPEREASGQNFRKSQGVPPPPTLREATSCSECPGKDWPFRGGLSHSLRPGCSLHKSKNKIKKKNSSSILSSRERDHPFMIAP